MRQRTAIRSQHQKINTTFLVLIIFLAIGISPVLSTYTKNITIGNFGRISFLNVNASSGSAIDIQAAVDQVVAESGIGNVYIPSGIFIPGS